MSAALLFADFSRYAKAADLIDSYLKNVDVSKEDKEALLHLAMVQEIKEKSHRDWASHTPSATEVPKSFFQQKAFSISDQFIQNKPGITGVKGIISRETDVKTGPSSRIKTLEFRAFGLLIYWRKVTDHLDGQSVAETSFGEYGHLQRFAGKVQIEKNHFSGLAPRK